MSKVIPAQTVEYAYVTQIVVSPNASANKVLFHRVHISYDLKDANKVHISFTSVDHFIPRTGMESTVTINEKVAAALEGFVALDKYNLSGFGTAPTA